MWRFLRTKEQQHQMSGAKRRLLSIWGPFSQRFSSSTITFRHNPLLMHYNIWRIYDMFMYLILLLWKAMIFISMTHDWIYSKFMHAVGNYSIYLKRKYPFIHLHNQALPLSNVQWPLCDSLFSMILVCHLCSWKTEKVEADPEDQNLLILQRRSSRGVLSWS